MSTPVKRHTKGRRDRARTQYLQKPAQLQACSNCATPKKPHVACHNCGQYKGRKVLEVAKKTTKKA